MAHFGIICPQSAAHINPMKALALELAERGHSITFFCIEDTKGQVTHPSLNLEVIGKEGFPLGTIDHFYAQLDRLNGFSAGLYLRDGLLAFEKIILQETPAIIRSLGIDILLVTQLCPAGGTVAEFLKIPFVTVCSISPLNYERKVPPCFVPWQYSNNPLSLIRNFIAYSIYYQVRRPIHQLINQYRQNWNLEPFLHPDDAFSSLAQICQLPPLFEFPRSHLPSNFYFTGPFTSISSRKTISFPYEQLSDAPLVYASLGTTYNRNIALFQAMASAASELNIQMVISLGGGGEPTDFSNTPANVLMVKYAPQLELLQRAVLTITHAGMNTTLESLSNGVPLVALPIASDQPAVAARITWTRTGLALPPQQRSSRDLQLAIEQVLSCSDYRDNALRIKADIESAGGIHKAIEIIENCTHR